jgi:WD40 repeat protein/DNA replication protein DnaC
MEKLIHGQIAEASMEEIRRVMPKKTLMVFVSSTFDDSRMERDILHKNILPHLQAMGQQHGIQVILYDMRFGVKDENTLRHMTWVTCKEGIEQCHEGSDGLFFLSLQADRYGSRLLPKYLDEDILLKALNNHEPNSVSSDLIRQWYILDANHHSPRYELKNLASLADSDYWNTVLPSFREFCLDSVPFETIPGLPETKLLINRSVTEWETLFALGCDKERCHWIQRSFNRDSLQSFSSNPNCSKLTDVFGNPVSARKLDEFRSKLKEILKDDQRNALPCRILPKDYLNRIGSEEYAEEWEAVARTCLENEMKKVILKCNEWKQGIYGIPEDHVEEIVHHCSTAYNKSQHFFGREELLQTALEKIRNFKIDESEEEGELSIDYSEEREDEDEEFRNFEIDDSKEEEEELSIDYSEEGEDEEEEEIRNYKIYQTKNEPFSGISLALIGKSGCGKTAMMSMLALSFQSQEKAPVIIRFCGTSKFSLSGLKLVQSISLQLLAAHGKFAEVERMIALLSTQDYETVVKQFQSLISEYPVMLFIDSLDQLENRNEERSKLSFLRDIRPHEKSRIIVSTLPDEYDEHGKPGKYFYQCERILKAEQVTVQEVGVTCQIEFTVRSLLDARQRGITPDQWTVVLDAVSYEPTILYINLAVEVITKWRSFDKEVFLQPTVKGIITQIFEGLEKSFGIAFTSTVFAMMAFSREGINDIEMQDLLSLHEGVLEEVFQYSTLNCFPIHVWLRLKHVIRNLVTEKENHCIKWYHRQLWETAIERYSEKEKECHSIIGRYFSNLIAETERIAKKIHQQPLTLNDVCIWTSNCSVNRRRVIEGYHHLIEGGLFEEAIEEMCSLEFVCASALSGDLFNIVRQMGKLTSVFHGEETKMRKLDHYFRWIRKRSSLISSNPSWMTRSTAGEEPTESEVKQFYSRVCIESLKANRIDVCEWENCKILTISGKSFFDAVEVEFHGHTDHATSLAWNHDGSQVASGSYDGKVLIWDAKTGELVLSLDGNRYEVSFIKWNHDSSQLISVSCDTIVIWDCVTGELVKSFNRKYVRSVAWNNTGSKFVSGSEDMMVDIWDVATGSLLITLKGHTDSVDTVAFSHNGLKILSGSEDKTIKMWDAMTGNELKTLEGHSNRVLSVAWKHDDSKIISGSDDRSVKIWDGELINSIDIENFAVSVGWCRKNDSIVLATGDGEIQIWEETSGKLLHSLSLNRYALSDWNYDQSQFVSSEGNTCRIWNNSSERSNKDNEEPGFFVSWNSDETMILTSSDRKASIWDVTTGNFINDFKTGTDVASVVWNHDETKLLVINYYERGSTTHSAGSGDIQVWDVKTSELVKTIPGKYFTRRVRWNSQRNMIASLLPEKKSPEQEKKKEKKAITICNTNTGELIKSFECDPEEEVNCLAWSHNDMKIVSGGERSIAIWNVETGNLSNRVTVTGSIKALAWSHDDTKIVAAVRYETIVVLDVCSGKLLKSWEGDSGWVPSIVWSHDDQRIVSGSNANTIKIWDANTGKLQSTLIGHTNEVASLEWSRDGSKILSGSCDKTVKIWINR